MSELAKVTVLRPREEQAEPTRPQPEGSTQAAYWERMQALRGELARLQRADASP